MAHNDIPTHLFVLVCPLLIGLRVQLGLRNYQRPQPLLGESVHMLHRCVNELVHRCSSPPPIFRKKSNSRNEHPRLLELTLSVYCIQCMIASGNKPVQARLVRESRPCAVERVLSTYRPDLSNGTFGVTTYHTIRCTYSRSSGKQQLKAVISRAAVCLAL